MCVCVCVCVNLTLCTQLVGVQLLFQRLCGAAPLEMKDLFPYLLGRLLADSLSLEALFRNLPAWRELPSPGHTYFPGATPREDKLAGVLKPALGPHLETTL